jgi:4-amino-4-deoxy-L-arabinose transferase-like glycosyltransferase
MTTNEQRHHNTRQTVLLAVLLTVTALAAFLRLPRLRTVPAWYPDEGSWITITSDLLKGQSAYMVFGGSALIAGRPPLFHWLLAGLFCLTGVDIFWARLLTVTLGLLTLLLLYVIANRMCGQQVALLAAAFYAIYPSAVVYNRLALTYNLLAPLYLLALYALWRAAADSRGRWIALAALCTGVALLTDWAAVSLLGFLILALLFIRPRALLWSLPLALLPFLIWVGAMWFSAGAAFAHDLVFTLARTNAVLPIQVARIVFYRTTLEGDVWLTLGGLGLLVISGHRQRWLAAGLFGFSLLVFVRNGPALGQSSYFLIPLFPLAALGMGEWLNKGISVLIPQVQEAWYSGLERWQMSPQVRTRWATWLTALVLFLLLLTPALSMVAEGIWLNYSLYTERFGDTVADPITAGQVADYVNGRTSPDDVVLVSPTIAWLVHARAADFQMAVAATGKATVHFPANLPPSRFRFDPRLENARYVILDPLWQGWASDQMPEVAEMVQAVQKGWILEKRFGKFQVYRQPSAVEK